MFFQTKGSTKNARI